MVTYFLHDELFQIRNLLLACGINGHAQIDGLLSGLAPEVAVELPYHNVPARRLLIILEQFNHRGRSSNGEIPLERLLQNAAVYYVEGTSQAVTLQKFMTILKQSQAQTLSPSSSPIDKMDDSKVIQVGLPEELAGEEATREVTVGVLKKPRPTERKKSEPNVRADFVLGSLPEESDVVDKGLDLVGLEKTEEAAVAEAPAEIRYLNVGFYDDQEQLVPAERPLIQTRLYSLMVNIGEMWGVRDERDEALPAIAAEVFEQHENQQLPLEVCVYSPYFDNGYSVKLLKLPLKGNSALVKFPLGALNRQGGRPQRMGIELFYQGHLLQARRLEFKVVADETAVLPESAWPAQHSYTIFTRIGTLTLATLKQLEESPRLFTVQVERDDEQQLGLHFRDQVGEQLDFYQTDLGDTNLKELLDTAQTQLLKAMGAFRVVMVSQTVFVKHLHALAEAGQALYTNLLPKDIFNEEPQPLDRLLKQGNVLQINPLTPNTTVPWELLYERPLFSYAENSTAVCDSFVTHPQGECPHHDDPNIVCPQSFWGFKYVIEQIPYRHSGSESPPARHLAKYLYNSDRPLAIKALVNTEFTNFTTHWLNLKRLLSNGVVVSRLKSHREVGEWLQAPQKEDVDLVYVYAHGGQENKRPYLDLGDGRLIKTNDWQAWRLDWREQAPLLLLNACESADYGPEDFESLISLFAKRGAVGVVGAQCSIPEQLADAFALRFLAGFLRQGSVGEAILDARLGLMRENGDPRGLVYSLFAPADVCLARPVLR